MATIEKRCRHPRAKWDECGCTFYLRQRSRGRTHYTRLGPDRKVAERALARLGAEQEETMTEALTAWMEAKEREPGARANSIAAYHGRLPHIRDYFGHTLVRSVRPEHLSRFVADLLAEGYKPSTVQGVYSALTATLRHAQRRGVIRDLPLPVGGPGIPSPHPLEHDLTLEQVEGIIERMTGTWKAVAELVLLTGMRFGEVVAVRAEDINGQVLRVRRTASMAGRKGATNPPKTKAGARPIPLSPRAQEILAGMDLPVGGDYRQARTALVTAMGDLHQAGMGWHSLRNAHSTLMDSAGVSLRESSARMGHGARFAQTLAYRVTSEAGDASALDRARER